MQYPKKFSELQWFRYDLKLEVLFIKLLKKNWSLWFSRQKNCKFLSNSVHFQDSHLRYAQNDSLNLGITSFLKKSRSVRSLAWSCEKKQAIFWAMGTYDPSPPSAFFRVKKHIMTLNGTKNTDYVSCFYSDSSKLHLSCRYLQCIHIYPGIYETYRFLKTNTVKICVTCIGSLKMHIMTLIGRWKHFKLSSHMTRLEAIIRRRKMQNRVIIS